MDILGERRFDFLGKRKIAFVFSIILAIIGLTAAVSIPLGKANLGTDFAGGVAMQFRFDKSFEIEKVRSIFEKGGFPDVDLQEITGENKLFVRVKRTGEKLGEFSDALGAALSAGLPENPYVIDSSTEIGPTVGKKLQKDALWAIIVALIGIMFYVAWRFEFRFGVAAVVATVHDVLAVLGIVFILGNEINLLIVTALLTISGYSLTDTVVVFDRIRENIRKRNKENLEPLINRSINEVLRRTIVTSGTTLLVLLALIFMGGEVIHDFALTLAIGVIVGTYSSIFVASPILLLWKGGSARLIKAERAEK
ncbi:MAG: protein translocase subunit SecF, partial [Deltaproteobacteria bacterium]|nr:protein translocase subunit SecF [Deltaproteobacteria bacterium]